MDTPRVRESNFELLRLVAMYFILLYHMLSFFIVKVDDAPLYKALWLPLHIAVACFVLISGYFHIKPSFKGIVKLLAPLIVCYLPLTFCESVSCVGGGIKNCYSSRNRPIGLYEFTFTCL